MLIEMNKNTFDRIQDLGRKLNAKEITEAAHDSLKNQAYLDVSLNNFDKNQVNSYIEQSLEQQACPDEIRNVLKKNMKIYYVTYMTLHKL